MTKDERKIGNEKVKPKNGGKRNSTRYRLGCIGVTACLMGGVNNMFPKSVTCYTTEAEAVAHKCKKCEKTHLCSAVLGS